MMLLPHMLRAAHALLVAFIMILHCMYDAALLLVAAGSCPSR
jgi:hypothetical protein